MASGVKINVGGRLDSIGEVLGGLKQVANALPDEKQRKSGQRYTQGVAVSLKRAFKAVGKAWEEDVADDVDRGAKVNPIQWDSVYRHLYSGGDPKNAGDETHRLFKFSSETASIGIELYLDWDSDPEPSWSPVAQGSRRIGGASEGEPYPPWQERAKFALGGLLDDPKYKRKMLYGYRDGRGKGPGPKYILKPFQGRYFYSESFHTDYSSSKDGLTKKIKDSMRFTATELTSSMSRGAERAVSATVQKMESHAKMEGTVPGKGKLGRGRTKKAAPSAVFGPSVEYGEIWARMFEESMKAVTKGR